MHIIAHHGVRPTIHPTAFVATGACIIGAVEVGEECGIWFNAVLRGDINHIRIGRRTNIQDGTIIHVTHEYPVEIADEATVGHQAMLHGCTIGYRALIGMNAVILDNARIGPYALVAAGSVVRENVEVPEGMLVAGVPARVVRPLTPEERKGLEESAEHYVQYARSYGPV
ncbi:MAG: gamma carbonic anhydrase family protein [Bacteroidetes bacterium]|nr:gamma carbonic anhydrase family protein [Bacteroidota bacterium]